MVGTKSSALSTTTTLRDWRRLLLTMSHMTTAPVLRGTSHFSQLYWSHMTRLVGSHYNRCCGSGYTQIVFIRSRSKWYRLEYRGKLSLSPATVAVSKTSLSSVDRLIVYMAIQPISCNRELSVGTLLSVTYHIHPLDATVQQAVPVRTTDI